MARIMICFSRNHRYDCRWILILLVLSFLVSANATAQTYIGLSLNVGDRQHYKPSWYGFESALAPSGSFSLIRNKNLNDDWSLRFGATAGILGYKLNVVMIDTLGPNGDVSPFPEYSTFFASAELLFGRRLPIFRHHLLIGAGLGITAYVSSTPRSSYSVGVIMPNNERVALFDARMTSPASDYSLLWKIGAYYDISSRFSVGVEYVYHNAAAAKGSYIFYHTRMPHSGTIEIYQREFRLGVFYKLGGRE